VLAAIALTGCLGSDSGGQPASAGARIGVPARLVTCTDWRESTPSERSGVIKAIRQFAGGPTGTPGRSGATLPDDKAYELFEGYCRRDYARAFKLYKLYTRAASFGVGR
jgi:hypothetical protein